jgi:hypothetical protein
MVLVIASQFPETPDPDAVRAALGRLGAEYPDIAPDDFGAAGLLAATLGELQAFTGRAMAQLVEMAQPLGLVGDANFGEVIDSIPDDWTDSEPLGRLASWIEAIDRFPNAAAAGPLWGASD